MALKEVIVALGKIIVFAIAEASTRVSQLVDRWRTMDHMVNEYQGFGNQNFAVGQILKYKLNITN